MFSALLGFQIYLRYQNGTKNIEVVTGATFLNIILKIPSYNYSLADRKK